MDEYRTADRRPCHTPGCRLHATISGLCWVCFQEGRAPGRRPQAAAAPVPAGSCPVHPRRTAKPVGICQGCIYLIASAIHRHGEVGSLPGEGTATRRAVMAVDLLQARRECRAWATGAAHLRAALVLDGAEVAA